MSSLGRIYPEVLEKILKVINAFLLFCDYLHLRRVGPSYQKIESHAFCQVWLKIGEWFLRRRSCNSSQCIFYYFQITCTSPFRWDVALYFHKLEFPSQKNALCQGLVVLEKKIFKICQFIFIISQLFPL